MAPSGIAAHKALQGGASEGDVELYRGKLQTLKYFTTYEVAKVDGLVRALKASRTDDLHGCCAV